MVLKAGVVDNRDAVRGSVGNPQLARAAWVEFHIGGLIEVVCGISDDHLNKAVTKGVYENGFLGLGGVGWERKEKHQYQKKSDPFLHHIKNQSPFAFDILLFVDASASQIGVEFSC